MMQPGCYYSGTVANNELLLPTISGGFVWNLRVVILGSTYKNPTYAFVILRFSKASEDRNEVIALLSFALQQLH